MTVSGIDDSAYTCYGSAAAMLPRYAVFASLKHITLFGAGREKRCLQLQLFLAVHRHRPVLKHGVH